MKKEYALYRGDEFIDLGTLRELSERLGKNPKTILFYGTPANIRRSEDGRNSYILIRLQEDEKKDEPKGRHTKCHRRLMEEKKKRKERMKNEQNTKSRKLNKRSKNKNTFTNA